MDNLTKTDMEKEVTVKLSNAMNKEVNDNI